MKRIIYKDDECESGIHSKSWRKKPEYICRECDNLFCSRCAEELNYVCDGHEAPILEPII